MELFVLTRAYNMYGGGAIFSYIGDLLLLQLGNYGDAITCIEVVVFLRSPVRNPKYSLEQLYDEHHAYLNKLPKVTFRRKLKRIEIEFLSESFDETDYQIGKPSFEKSQLAAEEIVEALTLVKKRLKSRDDFQTDKFLQDVKQTLCRTPDALAEWEALQQRARQKRAAVSAAKNPWEMLDLDWSKFHPRARRILDDPFYWEGANDLAPNGNDTGSDLFADFQTWNKRNAENSPLVFLKELSRDWGFDPIDWSLTSETDVLKLEDEQSIELSICNEAAIGLAFATLKMRASCPTELVKMAVNALRRTSILVKHSRLTNETKADWDVAIEMMQTKLESLLN